MRGATAGAKSSRGSTSRQLPRRTRRLNPDA
jgi:hypothetical protein